MSVFRWSAVLPPRVDAGGSPQTVSPSGIATAEAFGTASITTLATISPSGIASAEAFGTVVLTTAATISPSGISQSAFGSPTVTGGAGPSFTPNIGAGRLTEFRRLAGAGGESLGEQAAANDYAGTTGRSIVAALNVRAGRTDPATFRTEVATLRELAGKPDLDEGAALNSIPTP